VYRAAQDEFKADILSEFVNLVKDNPYPILIGVILIFSGSVMRNANAGLMIIGLSYSMLSLTVWICKRF
jgi:hypothetical protein